MDKSLKLGAVILIVLLLSPGILSTIHATSPLTRTITITITKTETITETITTTTTITTGTKTYTITKTITTGTVTIQVTKERPTTKHTTITRYTTTTTTSTVFATPKPRVDIDLELQPHPLLMGRPSRISMTIYNLGSVKIPIKLEIYFFYPKDQPIRQTNPFIGEWPLEPSPFEDSPFLDSRQILLDSDYKSVTIDLPSASWNWIPKPNLLKTSSEKVLRIIANILSAHPDLVSGALLGTADVLLAARAFATYISAVQSMNYKVVIKISEGDTGRPLLSREFNVEVLVPVDKKMLLGVWLISSVARALAGLSALVIGVILSGGAVSPFLPLILSLIGVVMWGVSLTSYLAAYDPDPNYTIMVNADEHQIPETLREIINSLPEGPEKRLAKALGKYYSLMNSFARSLAKYYGAAAEDDKNSMIMHLGSAESALRAANECLQEIIEHLRELGVANEKLPKLDPKQMEKILENVTFSEDIQRLIDELGISGYKEGLKLLAQNIPDEAFNMTLSSYMETLSKINKQQASHIRQALENITKGVETTSTTIKKVSKIQTSSTISTAGLKPTAMLLTCIIVAASAIIALTLLIKRKKEKAIEWSTDDSIEWIFKFKVISGER